MVNKLRFSEDNILGQVISRLEMTLAAMKRNNRAARDLSKSIAELNAKLLMLEQLPVSYTHLTADGREKPFEMKMQFHKAVVKVLVIIATDRTKTPVSLTFEDGKEYSIDRVCSRQRAAATKVGGTGIRYTIMIGGRQTYLFEDEDQWFVEAKNLHI